MIGGHFFGKTWSTLGLCKVTSHVGIVLQHLQNNRYNHLKEKKKIKQLDNDIQSVNQNPRGEGISIAWGQKGEQNETHSIC